VGLSVITGWARTSLKMLVVAVAAMKADMSNSNATRTLARRRIKT